MHCAVFNYTTQEITMNRDSTFIHTYANTCAMYSLFVFFSCGLVHFSKVPIFGEREGERTSDLLKTKLQRLSALFPLFLPSFFVLNNFKYKKVGAPLLLLYSLLILYISFVFSTVTLIFFLNSRIATKTMPKHLVFKAHGIWTKRTKKSQQQTDELRKPELSAPY